MGRDGAEGDLMSAHETYLTAARQMLSEEGNYLALVSKALVEQMAGKWSDPVLVKLEPADDGTIEIIVQKVES